MTGRLAAGLAMLAVMMSCTTYVQRTTCEHDSTSCSGIHDARFCEYVATAVKGTDCAALGVGEARHFCVVTSTACIDTNYVVKGQDCRVLRYEAVRESIRDECPTDAPLFVNR